MARKTPYLSSASPTDFQLVLHVRLALIWLFCQMKLDSLPEEKKDYCNKILTGEIEPLYKPVENVHVENYKKEKHMW